MMKTLIIPLMLCLGFFARAQDITTDTSFILVDFKTVDKPGFEFLEGAWELISFDYYENDMIIDSAQLQQGYRQVKIFQQGYILWAREVPSTADKEWYGFGTYEIVGDTLLEHLDFGSHELMKQFEPEHEFLLRTTGEDRFRQIRFNNKGYLVSSENYKRLSTPVDLPKK